MPRRLRIESNEPQLNIRIAAHYIGMTVVQDVVDPLPSSVVGGKAHPERLRMEAGFLAEAIVDAVQSGMTDLGNLHLLVQEERSRTDQNAHWLRRQVNGDATERLQ